MTQSNHPQLSPVPARACGALCLDCTGQAATGDQGQAFEQFKKFLAQELMVDEEKIIPEASFIEDLLVDSIRMVEMILRLEEEGLDIPLEAAWQIETVGDAYQYYVDRVPAEA